MLAMSFLPSEQSRNLQQVLEFCSCFSSAIVWHDLVFEGTMKEQALGSVVNVVARSDLDLVAIAYDTRRSDRLHLRLEGGSHRGIETVWQGIADIPGIVLAAWQSSTGARRQCETTETVSS